MMNLTEMLAILRHTLELSPVLSLFLVIGIGYALGRISIFGFSLGVGGVLFSGLALGAFAPAAVPPGVVGSIGLLLFLYGVGIQYGAQFFAGLRGSGKQANIIALVAVLGGLGVAVWGGELIGITLETTIGIFAGSMTSTAALQASMEAASTRAPAIGYPFGVVGPMLCLYLTSRLLKPVLAPPTAAIVTAEITLAELAPTTLGQLASMVPASVQVIAVRRGHQNLLPSPDQLLGSGDGMMLAGSVADIDRAREILGHLEPGRLSKDRRDFDSAEMFVSDAELIGIPLAELKLEAKFPLKVAYVRRGDAMMLPAPQMTLEFGDRVMVLAAAANLVKLRKMFGNSITATAEFSYVSLGLGMALGVLLGMIKIPLPGIGSFSLGLAGGPLVMALILGRVGRVGRVSFRLPLSANIVMRNFGLTLFLAAVGMASGLPFLTQIGANGLPMLVLGVVIVMVVVVIVLLLGRLVLKMPYDELFGIAAGATGNPAIVVFANRLAQSDRPNVGYAMIFPSMTIAKIVMVQMVLRTF